ncbi:hypothetical protein O3P69_006861 [Scylla paramamosain]|uniref:Uncharacterized protein n=1 Tax=Scylla paramamosain TaxID=85552 RepID=A0AAW0U4Y5_SCYPA
MECPRVTARVKTFETERQDAGSVVVVVVGVAATWFGRFGKLHSTSFSSATARIYLTFGGRCVCSASPGVSRDLPATSRHAVVIQVQSVAQCDGVRSYVNQRLT